jgi:cell division protein FtsW (lipid II flippase)
VTLRNRELVNLFVVAVITGLGFASVYIARQEVVSTASLSYALFFFGLYLVAHVVARLTVPNADPYLLPMAGLLTAFGVTEIYRLDPDNAFRQGLWIVVGVGVFSATLILLRRDFRRLESYKYIFGITSIVLLALPALPLIGQTVNGARLWVKLGPLHAIWGAAMLVLVETNDLGSALLYFGIFLAMLYVATGRALFVGAGLALFLAGATVVYHLVTRVESRVTIWLHPWTDERVFCSQTGGLALRQECDSYQLVKSLYSIGNGGFGGKGLGQGTFANSGGDPLIPYLNTDFIYSALAQELGLIGAAALVLLYMLFCLRGFRTALLAQDGFSKLLAVGLTFGFALQTFIIVGGVLRLIPLTGITLPFVSYGGSSIVANFILLAGLLLVSNRANASCSPR